MSDILEKLHREARYALNSHSLNLTYQTYGKAETAARRSAGNDLPALMMAGQKDVIF